MRLPNEPTQKEVELRVLHAARKADVPIPTGEISGEEPDLNTAHSLRITVFNCFGGSG
jgi:hypothetical protein